MIIINDEKEAEQQFIEEQERSIDDGKPIEDSEEFIERQQRLQEQSVQRQERVQEQERVQKKPKKYSNKLIRRVFRTNSSNQKMITIPNDYGIEAGDYVRIEKVE